MTTLTIRLTDDKAVRLKALAKARSTSVNKLVDELATVALVEFDVETRYRAMSARADPQAALAILDALDASRD